MYKNTAKLTFTNKRNISDASSESSNSNSSYSSHTLPPLTQNANSSGAKNRPGTAARFSPMRLRKGPPVRRQHPTVSPAPTGPFEETKHKGGHDKHSNKEVKHQGGQEGYTKGEIAILERIGRLETGINDLKTENIRFRVEMIGAIENMLRVLLLGKKAGGTSQAERLVEAQITADLPHIPESPTEDNPDSNGSKSGSDKSKPDISKVTGS